MALRSYPFVGAASAVAAVVGAAFATAAELVIRWFFEPLLGTDQTSNRVAPWRLGLLVGLNMICALWWATAPIFGAPGALVANASLGLLNLLFLVAAYCAVGEAQAVMNFELEYSDRRFARGRKLLSDDQWSEIPTVARNLQVVLWIALLFLLQLAVGVQWLDSITRVLTPTQFTPSPYVNALIATLGQAPFISVFTWLIAYLGQFRDWPSFAPGLSYWLGASTNALLSLLVVGSVARSGSWIQICGLWLSVFAPRPVTRGSASRNDSKWPRLR